MEILFNNGNGVFGDFGIFGSFPFALEETGVVPEKKGEEDYASYLKKGEKILSLLRKRKEKRTFKEDDILKGCVKSRFELTLNAVEKRVGNKMEEEFVKTLQDGEFLSEALDKACKELAKKLPRQIIVQPEVREMQRGLVSSICSDRQKAVINVLVPELLERKAEDIVLPVDGGQKRKYVGLWKYKYDAYYTNLHIFTRWTAEMYLRRYVLDSLRALRSEAGSAEEYYRVRSVGNLKENLERGSGVSFAFADLKEARKKGYCSYAMVLLYPESEEAENAVLSLPGYELQKFLVALKSDYDILKEEHRMFKEMSKEHARSFETKKNIPEKCIRAMSKSGFNKYFGYVEFDEECDLKLTEELSREYRAFAKELGIKKYPEVSLRFRKLGNHKASGLYYPLLKCLCVDVRTPSSFAHEVGHMIDYHMDHISMKHEFSKVYSLYENLLSKKKKADSDVKKQLEGKSKYNMSYYLQPTEVFARCFELYVVRIREIDNSLCKPSGFAYPESEELLDAIREFYDGILGYDRKEEKEEMVGESGVA